MDIFVSMLSNGRVTGDNVDTSKDPSASSALTQKNQLLPSNSELFPLVSVSQLAAPFPRPLTANDTAPTSHRTPKTGAKLLIRKDIRKLVEL